MKDSSSEDGNYNDSLEEEDHFVMAAHPQVLRMRSGDLSPPPKKQSLVINRDSLLEVSPEPV